MLSACAPEKGFRRSGRMEMVGFLALMRGPGSDWICASWSEGASGISVDAPWRRYPCPPEPAGLVVARVPLGVSTPGRRRPT